MMLYLKTRIEQMLRSVRKAGVFFLVLAGLAGIALVINYYASLSQMPNM